jgi:hypothetical protein
VVEQYSKKLMSNYMLNVSKKASKDPSSVLVNNFYFEHIGIENLRLEDLNVINSYKWKKSITTIDFHIKKEAILKGFMLLQSVLYDFRYIQDITIILEDSKENEDRDVLYERYGLRVQEFPALQILWMISKKAKNVSREIVD